MSWHQIGVIALALTVLAIPCCIFGVLVVIVYGKSIWGWTMFAAGVAMFLVGLWTILIIPRGVVE